MIHCPTSRTLEFIYYQLQVVRKGNERLPKSHLVKHRSLRFLLLEEHQKLCDMFMCHVLGDTDSCISLVYLRLCIHILRTSISIWAEFLRDV